MITDKLFRYLVQLFGGHTWPNCFTNLSQSASYQKVGFAH